MNKKGLFGGLFDLNHDGKLDAFERAADFGLFMHIINTAKEEKLKSAGIDPHDLETMDYFERRKLLEEAGLDPTDYE